MDVPTRCVQPTVRGRSTYTVLGFVGYAVGNMLGVGLALAWHLTLRERLVVFLLPPLAFVIVVFAARVILREERIVFYQVATAAVSNVLVVGWLAGAHVARCLDVTVVGVGTFLAFGRLGCFSVACCHGRPARFGVVYGAPHVRVGFWSRWSGRRLWPVQLVESIITTILVIIALVVGWREPGIPTLIYAVGYAVFRFALETRRGDSTRPHAYGLSEAQLTSLTALAVCAAWKPSIATIVTLVLVGCAAVTIVATRERRELVSPPHLRELDNLCAIKKANVTRLLWG